MNKQSKRMNIVGDYIHDTTKGYGWLLFPLKDKWLYYSKEHGISFTDKKYGFHNCTKTNIY